MVDLLLSSSFSTRGILVESGIQVYDGGNVIIFLLHPHILLLSSFSIHRTWRMTHIITTHLFLLLVLTLFFYNLSNTSDDITTDVMFDNILWSSFPYLVFFLSRHVGPCTSMPL